METIPASLLLKRFLVALVRDMTWVVGDPPNGMQAELAMDFGELLIPLLAWRIAKLALDPSRTEDGTILCHLGPLVTHRKRVRCRRDRGFYSRIEPTERALGNVGERIQEILNRCHEWEGMRVGSKRKEGKKRRKEKVRRMGKERLKDKVAR